MRAVKELEKRELIFVSTFNRAGFDKTQWYALRPDGIARLASLRLEQPRGGVFQNGTSTFQDETPTSQNGTSTSQNGTTIPETTSETTSEKNGYKIPTTIEEVAEWEAESARMQRMLRAFGKE